MKDYGTCKMFDVPGRGEVVLVALTTDPPPLMGEIVLVNGQKRIVDEVDLPGRVFEAARTGVALVLRRASDGVV